jgi:hypothetical protein
LRKPKIIHWENIKKISSTNLPISRQADYFGLDFHVWKVETSVEPKYNLRKKKFFFYISNGHEFHRELLVLISKRTGLEVNK